MDTIFLIAAGCLLGTLMIAVGAAGLYAAVMTRRGYAVTPRGQLVPRAERLLDRRGVVDEQMERYVRDRLR